MGRPDRRAASGLTQPQTATACVGRLRRHRSRRPAQRPRLRCVASTSSTSPNSTSGCLYRKICVQSRRTSIKMVEGTGRCDVINHAVNVDYFRSTVVNLDRRHCDDVITFTSGDSSNSSSPTHDVTQSVTSYSVNRLHVDDGTGSCDDVITSTSGDSSNPSTPTHDVVNCRQSVTSYSEISRLPADDETGTRSSDDVILSSSADSSNSSSSAYDVTESMTSRVRLPVDSRTRTGSVRRVEIVVQYGAGRLGVAVGGERPVKVKVVRQGGQGQLAGLTVGDEIIDVEGCDVSHSQPEVVAALLRSWTGDTLHLTVARPQRDDSGHASSSSSSLSSPDDVTSCYSRLPTPRDANYCPQQSTSGKQYDDHSLFEITHIYSS